MERIIKIFRRVMLAVVIIPFLSVFAMPDYSMTNAAVHEDIRIYDGDNELKGADIPLQKTVSPNFGNGFIWGDGLNLYLENVTLHKNPTTGRSMGLPGGLTTTFHYKGTNDIEGSVGTNQGDKQTVNFISEDSASIIKLSGKQILLNWSFTGGNVLMDSEEFSSVTGIKFTDSRIELNVQKLSGGIQFLNTSGSINPPSFSGSFLGMTNSNIKVTGSYNGYRGSLYLDDSTLDVDGSVTVFNLGSTGANGLNVTGKTDIANTDSSVSDDLVVNSGSILNINTSGFRISRIANQGSLNIETKQPGTLTNIRSNTGSVVISGNNGAVSNSFYYFQQPDQAWMVNYDSTEPVGQAYSADYSKFQPIKDGKTAKFVEYRSDAASENLLSPNSPTIGYGDLVMASDLLTGTGNGQPIAINLSRDGGTTYETIGVDSVLNLNAGTYPFNFVQNGDVSTWVAPASGDGVLNIQKAPLLASDFQPVADSYVYDGSGHVANAKYVDGLVGTNSDIRVTYKTFDGQDVTGNPTEAGVYRVLVTVPEDGDNYLATTTPIEIGTITIVPDNVPSEHIVVGDLAYVYDGKDHAATVTLDSKYGDITSIKYMTEGGKIIDKPTEAGRYEVLLSTSSKNYVPLDNEAVGVLTISQAKPTAKDFKYTQKATYTGSELNAKITPVNDLLTPDAAGAMTVKYNGNTALPVNSGKYDVTVEMAGGSNYQSTTVSLGTFEVTKAPVSKSDLTGKVDNAKYDGKVHGASYDWKPGVTGRGTLILTYKGEGYNGSTAPVNAGTYAVYASAPAGANYQALESVKVADLKISKADLTAKNFNDVSANYIYDFASHPAKVAYLPGTEGTAPITVTYKTAAGKAVSGAPTKAGTYDVYAQALKAGVNYNAMAKPVKVGTIKIAKADKPLPQIKVSENKYTYDGKSHQAKVTMDKKYGNLSVTYKDEQGKTVAKPMNAGVYQIIVNTVSDNFEALKNVTVGELTITAATPKSNEFTYTKNGTYNGGSQSAAVAYAPGVTEEMAGKMTVHYVDAKGNKINSITNAGTYKVYVSTTGGTNFKPVNNLLVGSMTIAKAPVVSDEFSVKDIEVTFNGQSQSPNVTLPAKYGDITKIEYCDENGKIYDRVENPGKYDILVTTKGTANYAGADRLVVGTFTIDEQTPEPTPTPAPNDNGGNAGGGATPAASTVVPASGPAAYNATTTVPASTVGTTTSAVAPATQTPTTGTQQTQATATPAADNATIRHGAVTDPLHGTEEVNDPVSSVAQKDTQGLSNYTIAGIWMAVAVALAGAFYISMRWMQVGRKRHLIQK